jgi:hypothetical protein
LEFNKHAGLVRWDVLFQILRRSAETDFHPQQADNRWIRHSMSVSERHDLQVTDDMFDAGVSVPSLVAERGAVSGVVTVRDLSQQRRFRH